MRVVIIPDEGPDEATRKELLARLEHEACRFCSGLHGETCPRIKHIVYHPTTERIIREVEFWADAEWDRSKVIFGDDLVQ